MEGARRTHVHMGEALHVDGRAIHRYEGPLETRVLGDVTTIIGSEEQPSSYGLHVFGSATISATKGLVLECPSGVELRCGSTSIVLGKERMDLGGKAIGVKGGGAGLECSDDGLKLSSKGSAQLTADDAVVKTKGASLGMGAEMRLDSSKVAR